MNCLDNIKKTYKDYKIIAFIKDINNEKIWKLVDINLIEVYKHAQHSIRIKNKIIQAIDHDIKSIYIFDIEKGIDCFNSIETFDKNKHKLLANRGRVRSNPIWRLIDQKLKDKYEGTLLSLKTKDTIYNSCEYRLNVVALKHIFSNEIILIHCESQKIAMKIK